MEELKKKLGKLLERGEIDINEYRVLKDASQLVVALFCGDMPINPTNGDVIKAMFPRFTYCEGENVQRIFDEEGKIVCDVHNDVWNQKYALHKKSEGVSNDELI